MSPPQVRKFGPFNRFCRKQPLNALYEDIFLGDVTTEAVIRRNDLIKGKIIACENGVLAGLEEALVVLGRRNCIVKVKEGQRIQVGQVVLVVKMRPLLLLAKIRVVLNYLSYMSGLASNARKLCCKVGKNKVAATRKTHPGFGLSEKRALLIGGVLPHRINLGDGILIKKEHISLIQKELRTSRPKAVAEAVLRAKEYIKKRRRNFFIEVEVEDLEEALEAVKVEPDSILLDNMKLEEVGVISGAIKRLNKNIVVEVSGGVNETNMKKYLNVGADLVSGSFVFNQRPLDFKFILEV